MTQYTSDGLAKVKCILNLQYINIVDVGAADDTDLIKFVKITLIIIAYNDITFFRCQFMLTFHMIYYQV